MKHAITIAGEDISLVAEEGDTLLRAALRAGIGLPYECNSGGCGSCKVEVIQGEVEDLWPDASGLSPRDRRKGRKLACQCRPVSRQVVIKARPEELPEEEARPRRVRARLLERRRLTHDMAEFSFAPHGEAPPYLPGQYAMFRLPGVQGERAYSFSSIPEEGVWRFVIRYTGGAATTFLFEALEADDELTLDAPYGHAWLRRDVQRDVVLIGGGSGLSPMLSIARAMVADPAFAGRTCHFFHGVRTPADICTPELLAELDGPGADIDHHVAISEPESAPDWPGAVGYIHELVERTLDDLPQYEFYFCGPPPMTECVQRMLMLKHKVPFQQLHFDRFF